MLGFSLWSMMTAIALFVNAVAILNEQRFLSRVGWGANQEPTGFDNNQDSSSFKSQSMKLISSVQTLLKIPLIGVNIVLILFELVLG